MFSCNERVVRYVKNAPAPSAVKMRGYRSVQKFNLFLNIVAFFLSIIAENVIIVCVNGVLSVTLQANCENNKEDYG